MYKPIEPYGRPSELTEQSIFDKVTRHLMTQFEVCEDKSENCVYRDETNRACAAGCLLNDDEAIESGTKIFHAVCPSDLVEYDNLINELQDIHDSFSPKTWHSKLSSLASRYNLKTSVLEEYEHRA